MKKLLILPLIISLLMNISCESSAHKEASVSPDSTSNILMIGLDDAAQNMDVLCFVSYKEKENEISFVQIPRDTYFNFGGTQNKINQIYSFYRAYLPQKEAMSRATKDIIEALAIPMDGYVAITTTGMLQAIDAIGGIDIEMLNSGVFTDEFGENPLSLSQGKNHLNGEQSIQFLRYRKGYLTGDLGRLDAQKLFFRGVLEKFSQRLGADRLIHAFLMVQNDIITDINVMDVIRMSAGGMQALAGAKVYYLTLPGEAAISSRGLSYYVLNRKGVMDVRKRYLLADSDNFDIRGKFVCSNEISFVNIYNDLNNDYHVYDNDTLKGIHIPQKQKS